MTAPQEWNAKHDLLFMYLCLGHLSDSHLNYQEIEAITEKFRNWLANTTSEEIKEIRHVVTHRYRELKSFNARYQQFLQSARNLKKRFLNQEVQLIEVMNDLIGIASSDQEINDEELTLIRAAVKTWWLDLDPVDDVDDQQLHNGVEYDPNRVRSSNGDAAWSTSHDLLYLLVAMGHLPDRQFTTDEISTIMNTWQRRYPDMKQEEFQSIKAVVMKKYNLYDSAHDRYNQFLICADSLSVAFEGKPRRLSKVLQDLFSVATADGRVGHNEIVMLRAAAQLFALDFDLSVDPATQKQLMMIHEVD